jgi:hypothetical protein
MPIAPLWGIGGRRGGPPVSTPVNQDAPTVGRTLFLPLPEDSPIPDAQEFNALGSVATAIVQSNIDIPLLPLIVVPASYKAVIRGVSIYINNMLATTNVTWTVRVNNNPIPGYSGLSIFPRVAPFVGNSFDAEYRFEGPATVTVSFSNIDGGAYTVGAAISGWFWPAASDLRWKFSGE